MEERETTMRQRFITKEQAHGMVKPTNRPVLDSGHEITVRPGVTLRRVQSGAAKRYRLTEK